MVSWYQSESHCRQDGVKYEANAVYGMRTAVRRSAGTTTLKPILRPYETVGTTHHVDFHTIKETYKTRADKCHVSHVAGDSGWFQLKSSRM